MALIQSPAVSSLAGAVTTNTATFASPTQTGSSIILAAPLEYSLSAGVTIAAADDKGNVYAVAFQGAIETVHSNSQCSFLWCKSAIAGAKIITLNSAGGTYRGNFVIFEAPGLASVDQTGGAIFSSITNSYTATATGADAGVADLVLAIMTEAGTGASDGISNPCTGGAAWTSAFVQQNGSVTNASQGSYRFNTSAVTNAATWGFTSNQAGAAAVISFQIAQSNTPVGQILT